MKSLVLCVCVLIIGSSSSTELKEQIKSAVGSIENDADTCLTEHDLTREDFYNEREIMTNVHTEPENEEKTKKIGCFMACVLKKQNLMEGSNFKEGQIHVKLGEMFQHDLEIHKVVRKCMKEARSITQECEKCFSMYVCVARAAHKAQKHEEHDKTEVETEGRVTEGEVEISEAETEQE